MSNKRLIETWVETWGGRRLEGGWAVHRAYEQSECLPDGSITVRVTIETEKEHYAKDHPEMQEMVRIHELATIALLAGSTKREVAT